MGRKLAAATAAGFAALCVAAATLSASTRSTHLQVGIYDEGITLYGTPAQSFAVFRSLHVQVVRINLHWGGKPAVAPWDRPAEADES